LILSARTTEMYNFAAKKAKITTIYFVKKKKKKQYNIFFLSFATNGIRMHFILLFLRNKIAFLKKTKKIDTFVGLSEEHLEKTKKNAHPFILSGSKEPVMI
jgi:glycopeptide antibiotics resistance protein